MLLVLKRANYQFLFSSICEKKRQTNNSIFNLISITERFLLYFAAALREQKKPVFNNNAPNSSVHVNFHSFLRSAALVFLLLLLLWISQISTKICCFYFSVSPLISLLVTIIIFIYLFSHSHTNTRSPFLFASVQKKTIQKSPTSFNRSRQF